VSLINLCTKSATIERRTSAQATANNLGGDVPTWATVYADLPVSIQPAMGRTVREFARMSMQISHTAYTPTPVSLQTGDRLTCDGITYTVQSFRDMAGRGSAFAIHLLRKN
jgi:hypothetical protein